MEMNTESQHVYVNGTRFGVVLCGKQEQCKLVLLHGFTGSAVGWGKLLENLALPGIQVIAIDMLGHGQSDAPQDPQRYTMEHCQTDLLAVLGKLGVSNGDAILLGYSMGGRVALSSAFSGFFRALILESASPGLADPIEREQRRISDMQLATKIERDGVASFVEHWENLPLFASQSSLPDKDRQELHTQRLNNRTLGLANSLRGLGTGTQPALHDRLATLDIPILLIAGELDSKFCEIARSMDHQFPQSQLHIVPGVGHTVHLEQPEIFVSLVTQFCTLVL